MCVCVCLHARACAHASELEMGGGGGGGGGGGRCKRKDILWSFCCRWPSPWCLCALRNGIQERIAILARYTAPSTE